jgi:hypothetical protein
LGPDLGRLLTAVGWCAFGALLIVPAAVTHVPAHWPPLLTVAGAYLLTTRAVLFAGALLLTRPVGAVAEFYLAPSGASTPCEEQVSQEQALVMQDRVELRRLLHRYPDSRVAPQLRQAIASLKPHHVLDERAD